MILMRSAEVLANNSENELTQTISNLIRSRRSIYTEEFVKQEITNEILDNILTDATWAPTHKMTEPWRFIVFQGSFLAHYGNFMANYYEENYSRKFKKNEAKQKLTYLKNYPLKACCLIGIILTKSKKNIIPEWEELAAVASAVQNLSLSCTSHGLGSFWSSKPVAIDYVSQYCTDSSEQSLGLLYLGYPKAQKMVKRRRTPIADKVTYLK